MFKWFNGSIFNIRCSIFDIQKFDIHMFKGSNVQGIKGSMFKSIWDLGSWNLEFGSWNLELASWIFVAPSPLALSPLLKLGLGTSTLEFGSWNLVFGSQKLIYQSSQYLFSHAVGVKAFSSVYIVETILKPVLATN